MRNLLDGCLALFLLFVSFVCFSMAANSLHITLFKLFAFLILIFIVIVLIAFGKYNDNKDHTAAEINQSHITIDEVPFSIVKNSDLTEVDAGKLYVKNKSMYELTEFTINGNLPDGNVFECSIKEAIKPGQVHTKGMDFYGKNIEIKKISFVYKIHEKVLRCVIYDKALNSYKIWDTLYEGGL